MTEQNTPSTTTGAAKACWSIPDKWNPRVWLRNWLCSRTPAEAAESKRLCEQAYSEKLDAAAALATRACWPDEVTRAAALQSFERSIQSELQARDQVAKTARAELQSRGGADDASEMAAKAMMAVSISGQAGVPVDPSSQQAWRQRLTELEGWGGHRSSCFKKLMR
ncbi:hypothetical protein [Corticibacter populi]|uniref:hypothetical protein n=1 Tax=Corticibacter populi TaxID=1550736 RepID=UPI00102CEB7C|nr:hypothetical protein [Corticibacter populi]